MTYTRPLRSEDLFYEIRMQAYKLAQGIPLVNRFSNGCRARKYNICPSLERVLNLINQSLSMLASARLATPTELALEPLLSARHESCDDESAWGRVGADRPYEQLCHNQHFFPTHNRASVSRTRT